MMCKVVRVNDGERLSLSMSLCTLLASRTLQTGLFECYYMFVLEHVKWFVKGEYVGSLVGINQSPMSNMKKGAE